MRFDERHLPFDLHFPQLIAPIRIDIGWRGGRFTHIPNFNNARVRVRRRQDIIERVDSAENVLPLLSNIYPIDRSEPPFLGYSFAFRSRLEIESSLPFSG